MELYESEKKVVKDKDYTMHAKLQPFWPIGAVRMAQFRVKAYEECYMMSDLFMRFSDQCNKMFSVQDEATVFFEDEEYLAVKKRCFDTEACTEFTHDDLDMLTYIHSDLCLEGRYPS